MNEGYIPGWPDRTICTHTQAGMHIMEFYPGGRETVQVSDEVTESFEPIERMNTLTGNREKGLYGRNMDGMYSGKFYLKVQQAKERTLNCLRGEGEKNFAE